MCWKSLLEMWLKVVDGTCTFFVSPWWNHRRPLIGSRIVTRMVTYATQSNYNNLIIWAVGFPKLFCCFLAVFILLKSVLWNKVCLLAVTNSHLLKAFVAPAFLSCWRWCHGSLTQTCCDNQLRILPTLRGYGLQCKWNKGKVPGTNSEWSPAEPTQHGFVLLWYCLFRDICLEGSSSVVQRPEKVWKRSSVFTERWWGISWCSVVRIAVRSAVCIVSVVKINSL